MCVFFVSEGRVEVSRDDKYLSTLAPGKVLGELAILYNCKRTATIKGKFLAPHSPFRSGPFFCIFLLTI